MLNINDLATREAGTTEFTDSKARVHKVKHRVVFAEVEGRELEEQIAEDLYRAFSAHTK